MTEAELIGRLEAGEKFTYSVLHRNVKGVGRKTLAELRLKFPDQIERDDPFFFRNNGLVGVEMKEHTPARKSSVGNFGFGLDMDDVD